MILQILIPTQTSFLHRVANSLKMGFLLRIVKFKEKNVNGVI